MYNWASSSSLEVFTWSSHLQSEWLQVSAHSHTLLCLLQRTHAFTAQGTFNIAADVHGMVCTAAQQMPVRYETAKAPRVTAIAGTAGYLPALTFSASKLPCRSLSFARAGTFFLSCTCPATAVANQLHCL